MVHTSALFIPSANFTKQTPENHRIIIPLNFEKEYRPFAVRSFKEAVQTFFRGFDGDAFKKIFSLDLDFGHF